MTGNRTALLSIALAAGSLIFACGELKQTESNGMYLEPELVQEANGDWCTATALEFTNDGRSSRPRPVTRNFTIGNNGPADLFVTKVSIQGFEGCDRIARGLRPSEPFGDDLDQRCTLSIDSGGGSSRHHATADDPFLIAPTAYYSYGVRYQPIDGMPSPGPTKLIIESNASGRSEVFVRLEVPGTLSEIDVRPTSLAFPAAVESTATVTVTNIGNVPLNVLEVTVDQTSPQGTDPVTGARVNEFEVVPNNALPGTIQPGRSEYIDVKYSPIDEGEDEGELKIRTASETVTVELNSGALGARLVVEPNPLQFEAPGEKTLNMLNAGGRAIEVTDIQILKASDQIQRSMDFALAAGTSTAFAIEGNQSQTVTVSYAPTSGTGERAILRIFNDSDAAANTGGYTEVNLEPSSAGVFRRLDVMPTSIVMGAVAEGESTSETLLLSVPIESAAVSVEAINIGANSQPGFEVTRGGGPVELSPGGMPHAVEVTYTRPSGEPDNSFGEVEIISNADDSAPISITVGAP